MIKKIILILLSLMVIFAFAGCQLAEEGKGPEAGTDALCGMFITFDYLNIDGGSLDNADWNAVISGGQPPLYSQEAGRIYAVSEDNGRTKDYIFKGIEGLRLFGVFVSGDGEHEGYNRTCADDLLLDRKDTYNTTDSGEEITLEATLYVCPNVNGGDGTFYCNPVYQTPGGEVYMTAGSGVSADLSQGGGSLTSTLSGSAEKTENGEKSSRKTTVKLTVTAIDYIEKYVLKEYDREDRVISALGITNDSVPKEITLNNDTVYAILEKHCIDANGKLYTERSILDMKSEYLDVRFINEKGFAQGYGITLKNIPASVI